MKILRLVGDRVSPAVAHRYTPDVGKRTYLNISHGVKGDGMWKWYAGLSARRFKTRAKTLVLSDDNYNLTPIRGKGLTPFRTDKQGNICYNIDTDDDPSHKQDILLLWTIPGRNYIHITHSFGGYAKLIGEGVVGKSRGLESYRVPAPVVEITGDCVLHWTGLNSEGVRFEQHVKYDYVNNEWDIGEVVPVTMET